MALRVTHLNGDTTFLLTFYPSEEEAESNVHGTGSFSVLVDPWLNGESTIFHRRFALAKHTVPCSIKHLSEIPTPNVVLVSQDRTDHCHEETLKHLDAELPSTIILAHPAAAKRIRGWKYFTPSRVVALPTFNDKKPDTVIRFTIPAQNPSFESGEATLSFIPSKFDITGTHNAMGITYRAPASSMSLPSTTRMTTTLPAHSQLAAPTGPVPPVSMPNFPLTPPDSPELPYATKAGPILELPPPSRGRLGRLKTKSLGAIRSKALGQKGYGGSALDLATMPPLPPLDRQTSHFTQSPSVLPATPSTSSASSTLRDSNGSWSRRPRTLSVLYSPHGVSYNAVRQYASSHLIQRAGLPLTLLLHAFDRVTNAWYLGGNIIAGLPGGVEIAQNLLAKCWISAHDEDKESSGMAVTRCVTDKYAVAEVKRLLDTEDDKKMGEVEKPSKRKKTGTDVRQLGVGEVLVLCA